MENVFTMLEAASLLILSFLGVIAIRELSLTGFWRTGILTGLLLAGVGVLVMRNGVTLAPGIHVDARAAVVAVSGAFGGPVSAVITGGALGAYRMTLGGAGAPVGVAYVASIAVASSLLWLWWRARVGPGATPRYVAGQALTAGIVPAIVVLALTGQPPEIYWVSIGLMVPTNVVSVWVLGMLMLADERRRRAAAAQAEVEARMAAIAANASVVLIQIARDRDGWLSITFMTSSVRTLLGVTPEEAVRGGGLLADMIAPGERTAFAERLIASAETRRPVEFEARAVRPDGRPVWLRFAVAPRGAGGMTIWDGSVFDVTAQKQAEETKEQFLAVVSHELRTPLTSINGALGLMANGAAGPLPDRAMGMVAIARKNGDRLIHLVNDLLDMERMRSGTVSFALKELESRPILEAVIAASRDYAPEKRIAMALLDDCPGAVVATDRSRLEQVLSNLLSNAIKFTPAGGLVTVATAREGDGVRFTVADEGPGIPDAFRDRIFGAFEQAEHGDTRRPGGTGLGLNIARTLTEGMGGRIGYRTGDRGSAFHVTFPLVRAAAPEAGHAGGRVLLCTADMGFLAEGGRALTAAGLACDVVTSAAGAERLAAGRGVCATVAGASALGDDPAPALRRLLGGGRDAGPVILFGAADAGSPPGVAALSDAAAIAAIGALVETLDDGGADPRGTMLHVAGGPATRRLARLGAAGRIALRSAATPGEARARIAAGSVRLMAVDAGPDGLRPAALAALVPDGVPLVILPSGGAPERPAGMRCALLPRADMDALETVATIAAALDPGAPEADRLRSA